MKTSLSKIFNQLKQRSSKSDGDGEQELRRAKLKGAFRGYAENLVQFIDDKLNKKTVFIVIRNLNAFLDSSPINQIVLYTLLDTAFNSTGYGGKIVVIGVCTGVALLEKRIQSRFNKKIIKIQRLREDQVLQFVQEKLLVEDFGQLEKFQTEVDEWNNHIEDDLKVGFYLRPVFLVFNYGFVPGFQNTS